MALLQLALEALDLVGGTVEGPRGDSAALVYRITAGGGERFALRVRPPQDAHLIAREARLTAVAADLGFGPALRGQYVGPQVACLATEWVAGAPVGERLMENPGRLPEWAEAVGVFLARMHGAAARHQALRRLDAGWARPRSPGEAARVRELPAGGRPTLVHLDIHPLNLVASPSRIAAAVDWVNAGVGDARLDVARTAAVLALDGPTHLSHSEALWQTFAAQLVVGYERTAGPLLDMAAFMRWAAEATLRDLRPKRSRGDLERMEAVRRRWDVADPWPPARWC